jgi:asparagine synthase (glutamine-hydrolysing)
VCGICGEWAVEVGDVTDARTIGFLTDLAARRGPDDRGIWTDSLRCSLGFRRLSILDVTLNGRQPMTTADGRYTLVFNGEVYNYREIRRILAKEGKRFRSTGDAEVVLQALVQWGTGALDRFNGMFALALYDTSNQSLLLSRDHAGIKPLYYAQTSRGVVFGSQYDQILRHPWSKNLQVSKAALSLYLSLGYVPAPYALLEKTFHVEPGTWLQINPDGDVSHGRFFEFPKLAHPQLCGEEAVEAVDAAVSEAVKRHLVSDVPVGCFLSGGIDSPLVAANVRAAERSIQAFTIGTCGDQFDESNDAATYARALGHPIHITRINGASAAELVDDVASACSEPCADYSIFPTLLVSQAASEKVKVVLSGDGGDELFWGYSGRFCEALGRLSSFRKPVWVRRARWLMRKLNRGGRTDTIPWRRDLGEWYRHKHSRLDFAWSRKLFPDLPDWPDDFRAFQCSERTTRNAAQWLRWNEYTVHLPMVLQKVDRASMYCGLEVRVPLLDRKVVDVASRIDWESCLDTKRVIGKLPLRKSLSRHVSVQTTTKRGFSVAMSAWLRGPLRPLLESTVLARGSLLGLPLCRGEMRRMFQEHLQQQADHGKALWTLMSLCLWEDRHFRP